MLGRISGRSVQEFFPQFFAVEADRCFKSFRLKEHARREHQPLFRHLTNCAQFLYLVSLNQLREIFGCSAKVNLKEHLFNTDLRNVEIIDSSDNWSSFQFLEAYYIKNFKPTINEGLKATRDLELF